MTDLENTTLEGLGIASGSIKLQLLGGEKKGVQEGVTVGNSIQEQGDEQVDKQADKQDMEVESSMEVEPSPLDTAIHSLLSFNQPASLVPLMKVIRNLLSKPGRKLKEGLFSHPAETQVLLLVGFSPGLDPPSPVNKTLVEAVFKRLVQVAKQLEVVDIPLLKKKQKMQASFDPFKAGITRLAPQPTGVSRFPGEAAALQAKLDDLHAQAGVPDREIRVFKTGNLRGFVYEGEKEGSNRQVRLCFGDGGC